MSAGNFDTADIITIKSHLKVSPFQYQTFYSYRDE